MIIFILFITASISLFISISNHKQNISSKE